MFIFFKVISGDWIGIFHKLFLLRKISLVQWFFQANTMSIVSTESCDVEAVWFKAASLLETT